MGGDELVDGFARFGGFAAGLVDQVQRKAVAVGEQGLEEVFGEKLGVARGERSRLRALDRGAGALGVAFEVHV